MPLQLFPPEPPVVILVNKNRAEVARALYAAERTLATEHGSDTSFLRTGGFGGNSCSSDSRW
jgi:hypothetical protein